MFKLHSLLTISMLFFIIFGVVMYVKCIDLKEEFKNVYHFKKSIVADSIHVNPANNLSDNDVKKKSGLFMNTLTIDDNNSLFVGNTVANDSEFNYDSIKNITEEHFPYLSSQNNDNSTVLTFYNKEDVKLTANHLRALQGKKLLHLFNKKEGKSKYPIKLEVDTELFEKKGLKCGFTNNDIEKTGKIIGVVDKEYAL